MAKAVTTLNAHNTTTNFYPASGDGWRMEMRPMKATLAMVEGALIAPEISGNTTTGNYTLCAATNSTGKNIAGILAEPIATTDTDYGTAGKLKAVWVPVNPMTAKSFFTVGTGTFTAADIGKVCNIHTDSISLAVDTNGLGAEITDYISATRGKCRFTVPFVVTA